MKRKSPTQLADLHVSADYLKQAASLLERAGEPALAGRLKSLLSQVESTHTLHNTIATYA